MSNNLADAGYLVIRYKDPTTGDLVDSEGNPYERFVDVLIDSESNEIVEPYFFLYNYGQYDRSIYYSVPSEGMNHSDTYANTASLVGNEVPSKNEILSYMDKIYLPQLHPSCYEVPVGSKPPLIGICTGSENNSVKFSMGHIYVMLDKNDVSVDLIARNHDLSFNNHSNRVSLFDEPLLLDYEDEELRSLVITLSQDVKEINYGEAIYGDEIERPVKWVVSNDGKSPRDLPSINRIMDLSKNAIKVTESHLYSMGTDIGYSNNFIDFNSEPLKDVNLSISSSSISINNIELKNEKPF